MTAVWKTLPERPGYFGSRRDEIHAANDARYGADGWRVAWQVGEVTVDRIGMSMLYEDAYVTFLKFRPHVLEQLTSEASEVYDDAPSNIASGLDYLAQETNRTHVQDIAIRRSLIRLGRAFRGPEPIQIRDKDGEHPLSITLSPGQVPFHRPDFIVAPELEGWWLPGSVESFYQSNKVIQVRVDGNRCPDCGEPGGLYECEPCGWIK